MKEHIKRKIDIGFGALPEMGTFEYDKVKNEFFTNDNLKLKEEIKKKFEKSMNSLIVQSHNGINIGMDKEIRYFLQEFNERAWKYGLQSMPSLFYVMESFFKYVKSLIYFQLLEEEDYLFSFYDFFNFYTLKKIEYKKELIEEYLLDNTIYNFNVGSDINEITFKSTNQESEFIIGGISLVRRKNEVTILLQVGELLTKKLLEAYNHPIDKSKAVYNKEYLKSINSDSKPIYLNNDNKYLKILILCIIDLDTQTIDSKYFARDTTDSFKITTNVIEVFLNDENEFINSDLKDAYIHSCKEIENYSALFEVAKASLYLPYYFDCYDEKIIQEEHQTKYYTMARSPKLKRKYRNVNSELKLTSRTLFVLNTDDKFSSDRIHIRDDKFKIETNGYWKTLSPNEIGMDKKGNQITGKTWVNRKESYYQANTDELIIERKKEKIFSDKNAGYIYVMRNAYQPKNTYKIGLTTNTTSERAKQLSKTSVPDKFQVMREWNVRDCYQAEKEIHTILDRYRIDPRREFFQLDMKEINIVIEEVINRINKDIS